MIEEEQSKKLIETDINLPEVPNHVPEKPPATSKFMVSKTLKMNLCFGNQLSDPSFLSSPTESKDEEELEELKQWAS